ncbi:glycosyltransferase [Methylobacterium brachiatum]|nr:glycosyltransferase [Methylobacterium brachiatum]
MCPYIGVFMRQAMELGHFWQDRYFTDGYIAFTHPVTGASRNFSVPHLTSWNTVFLIEEELGSCSVVSSIVGLGMPVIGIVLHDLGLTITWNESKFNFTDQEVEAHLRWCELNPTVEAPREVSLVIGHENFAHFLHNEISGLMRIIELQPRSKIKIKEILIAREPLGPPAEIFPELATVPTKKIDIRELSSLGDLGAVLICGDITLKNQQRLDVISYLERQSGPIKYLADRFRPTGGLVTLLLGFRTHSRRAGNLEHLYLNVARRLKEEFGELRLILDGFNLPRYFDPSGSEAWFIDVAKASSETLRKFEDLARTEGFSEIISTADLDVVASLWINRKADFYITNHGTQQHKAGWFSDAYGIVHGPPDHLGIDEVQWFGRMVEGSRAFDLIPAHHYGKNPSFGDCWSEGYAFEDIELTGNWIANRMIGKRRLEENCGESYFDPAWYLKAYPEVAEAGYAALDHYLRYGAAEGRQPNPYFDPAWYLKAYPEVAEAGYAALDHYLRYGAAEGRQPNPYFDPAWYLKAYPEVAEAGYAALDHYLRYGAAEGRQPNPYFDPAWYLKAYPEVAEAGYAALDHYLRYGAAEGRQPNPYFDPAWYLKAYPEVAEAGYAALDHYLRYGAAEGRQPNPYFDPAWYLKAYPEVAEAGYAALDHYLRYGAAEGRQPNPYFDPAWYLEQYIGTDAARSELQPLEHFITKGIYQHADPGPRFSTAFYLKANTDLQYAGVEAFRHFLHAGCREGRRIGGRPIPLEFNEGNNRILIIDSGYPTPDRDSGSLDTVNFIKIFKEMGYDVYFSASTGFYNEDLSDLAKSAKSNIEEIGAVPVTSAHAPTIRDFIVDFGIKFNVFFLSRVYCGGIFYETIREKTPNAKIIFNTVDLHGLREKRAGYINNDRSMIVRSYKTLEREYYLARMADATLVVSFEERDMLSRVVPGSAIHVVPLIRDVPGGKNPFYARESIGFIGGFNHAPNLDACIYFLDSIWPLVRAELPNVKFRIVGADLPDVLRQRNDPNIEFVGYVADLSTELDEFRLTVAPLRYGAGAKGKVASSLSHGVPCVATPVAAEGMQLESMNSILIGRDPGQFAKHVINLYQDEILWSKLVRNGLNLMQANHSFSAGITSMKLIFSHLGFSI